MRTLLALTVLLVVSACGGSTDPAPTARSTGFTDVGCADLVLVGVRGQEQSRTANGGLGTEVRLLTTRLAQVVQARSDVSVRRESIDYENDPPSDLAAYDRAVAAGATTLDARIDALESRCPDSAIAAIGFSMGAQVVHTALHDRPVGSIRLVTMIADPLRDPVATYAVDAFGQAAPQPGSLGAGPDFEDLADRTVAFCAADDDVCNHTPGEPRTAVDLVHKHFYEKPDHVEAMAREMDQILQRSGF